VEGHESLEGHQPAGVVHTLCQLVNDKVHCCARRVRAAGNAEGCRKGGRTAG
jgi:hypothetical protein